MTMSRSAAAKEAAFGLHKSSQSSVAVDHFELFSVGTKTGTGDATKKKRLSSTPPKRRKSSAFVSPKKSSSGKPRTPKKTPSKRDAFSPVARKLLDRAKGVMTSPRKSMARNDTQKAQQSAAGNGPRKSQGVSIKETTSKPRDCGPVGDMTRMKNRSDGDS